MKHTEQLRPTLQRKASDLLSGFSPGAGNAFLHGVTGEKPLALRWFSCQGREMFGSPAGERCFPPRTAAALQLAFTSVLRTLFIIHMCRAGLFN